MEAAITARLERVVQEVIEVRQRAQTLSDELELVRAERGTLLATLEKERAALAAARTALEAERSRPQVQKQVVPVESTFLYEEEPSLVPEPEAVPEPIEVPALQPITAAETLAPRLPSPRKLLGKLKFVGRNKGKAEEPVVQPASLTPKEEFLLPEPLESITPEVVTPVEQAIEFAPVALLEEEPLPLLETEPEPTAPVLAEKPKRAAKPRAAKPKKTAPLPRFAPREFLASLPGLDDDQLDLATFGIAQLDDDGAIVALNHQGTALLNTDKNTALDKILFHLVLPDTDVATQFDEGISAGKLDTVLPVEGGFTVHLFRHSKSRTNWALLRKQEGGEA